MPYQYFDIQLSANHAMSRVWVNQSIFWSITAWSVCQSLVPSFHRIYVQFAQTYRFEKYLFQKSHVLFFFFCASNPIQWQTLALALALVLVEQSWNNYWNIYETFFFNILFMQSDQSFGGYIDSESVYYYRYYRELLKFIFYILFFWIITRSF